MKRNMKQWMNDVLNAERKKAMPILGFPVASKMGVTVKELLSDSDTMAKGMKILAEDVDALANLTYMDLSIEAEAFGCEVEFSDVEVPNIVSTVITAREDAEALQVPQVGAARTGRYVEACKKSVELIDEKPVLAGCIGPFSLAGRLMDLTELMMKCRKDPEMVHIILGKCTQFITEYVKAYKAAGADGVAMAEPLAGLLKPKMVKEFSSEYVKKIVDAVQDENFIVVYHNCGSSTIKSVEEIVYCGASAYHFGNIINMAEMMDKFPEDTVAMGNVDPAGVFCNGTPELVRSETLRIMGECCKHKNFVISSGCDIPAHSPWENINAFFSAVDEFYEGK